MKAPAPWFPGLAADHALAGLQLRQTLALGLIPIGLAVLLLVIEEPGAPHFLLWFGGASPLAAGGILWGWWRQAQTRPARGYSTAHFLIRYYFLVLCPLLLWSVFRGQILEMAGWGPPVLFLLLLVIYPVGKILHERMSALPESSPRIEFSYRVCQQLEMVLAGVGVIGLITGAVLDASRDYPTDPTPLLLVLWLLAAIILLAGIVTLVAHRSHLFQRREPPQPLDDPPEEGERNRPPPPPRFGSQAF